MYQIYADGQRLWAPGIEDLRVYNISLEQEINKAGSLKFTMPRGHIMYQSLKKLNTTIYVKDGNDTIWSGRILNDSKTFYNQKEVYCEGALSFLMDSLLPPISTNTSTTTSTEKTTRTETVQDYFKEIIENHNSQVNRNRQFIVGTCDISGTVEIDRSSYTETLKELETLLDQFQGVLKVTYTASGVATLNYTQSYDERSGQSIQFGSNLLDLEDVIDASELCTVLIATGKTNDSQEDLSYTYVNESAAELYGKIYRHEDFGEVSGTDQLQSLAKDYFQKGNGQETNTFTVKAADLSFIDKENDRIDLGDFVKVVSVPHGINTEYRCTKITMPLENPGEAEYTLGDSISGLTDQHLENRKIATRAQIRAYHNTEDTTTNRRGGNQFYFSESAMEIAPDSKYVGHPVTKLTSAEQSAIVYTINGEMGGDLGGCMLVAQALRDYFDYYNHGSEGATNSWQHIISIHCAAEYWSYGSTINVTDSAYSNAYKAFKYVFVEGNSAVRCRMFAWADTGTPGSSLLYDAIKVIHYTPSFGYDTYFWYSKIFDTGSDWYVNPNSELYTSKMASISSDEINQITGSGSSSTRALLRAAATTEDDTVPDTSKYLDKVGLQQFWDAIGQGLIYLIAPAYDEEASYSYGQCVTYNGRMYQCLWETPNPAGAFSPSYFMQTTIGAILRDVVHWPMVAMEYSEYATYAVGDYVIYRGTLYRCTTAISTAESWNGAHWVNTFICNELSSMGSNTAVFG